MIRKAEAEAEADHSKWSKRREAQSLARNAEQQPVETKAKSKKNNNQRKKKRKKKVDVSFQKGTRRVLSRTMLFRRGWVRTVCT
jgi:hypothetical protein